MGASQVHFFPHSAHLPCFASFGNFAKPVSSGGPTAIELATLGGLHILDDEGELDWLAGQRSRAALLIYLAVEQRVSRDSLITVFWPESDNENARHALRQSLYQLKKAVRADWVESLAHDLVIRSDVRADVHEFTEAIEQKDLERAVALYRGAFLDGIHLVDLSSWESWVDTKRARYARAFRQASRDLIRIKLSQGDKRGAIRVAEQWMARDRMDDEAQHRLIETLASAGERAEAIRQYETWERARESDGLEPPEETRALVERLKAEPRLIPSLEVTAGIPSSKRTPSPRRRWSRAIGLGATGLVVGMVMIWGQIRKHGDTRAEPSAIAVLPFSVHGQDSVAYLREGMVNLLTAALDGAGSFRPVDARATLAAADVKKDPAAIAAQLGAGMYVVGDVTEAGGKLQISAVVYPSRSNTPSARAVVSGNRDSVFALADLVAARLLADLSDPHAGRLIRTASLTTSSLAAFKDFLDGDRQMRAGQFERAADSYEAAIAHDSTFAIAYYKLGLAREWAPLPGEDRAAARAAHFASRLSRRDRDLLEAFRVWRSGHAVDAARAYRAILSRYPDDVDAWFQLAEIQFHHGPLLGSSLGESATAWRQVLLYEPKNLFAITHLARIGIVENRLASVDSLLAKFSPTELYKDRRLIELAMLRAVARNDRSAITALTSETRMWEGLSAWRVAVFLTAFTLDPAAMRPIVHDLIDASASPSLRADVLWFASLLDLAGGKIRASWSGLRDARLSENSAADANRRPGFDAVIEWHAATLPLPYSDSALSRVRQDAQSRQTSMSPHPMFHHDTELGKFLQLEPLRLYTIGILSIRLRDTTEAMAASQRLSNIAKSRGAAVLTRDLDRGLRAQLAWHRRNGKIALALLDSLESDDVQGDVAATPFVARSNERYLHGEILESLGRHDEALKWFSSLGQGSVSEIPLRALSHYRQAEIFDRLRRPSNAAMHYEQFVKLWSTADPQLQALVDNARRKLTTER
jgi:DNA-binding SARP family transcriptional activator/TolB-like protein